MDTLWMTGRYLGHWDILTLSSTCNTMLDTIGEERAYWVLQTTRCKALGMAFLNPFYQKADCLAISSTCTLLYYDQLHTYAREALLGWAQKQRLKAYWKARPGELVNLVEAQGILAVREMVFGRDHIEDDSESEDFL